MVSTTTIVLSLLAVLVFSYFNEAEALPYVPPPNDTSISDIGLDEAKVRLRVCLQTTLA